MRKPQYLGREHVIRDEERPNKMLHGGKQAVRPLVGTLPHRKGLNCL